MRFISESESFTGLLLVVVLLLLLLLKEVGNAWLGESDIHHISLNSRDPSATIPNNRQIEENGKNSRRQNGIEQLRPIKNHRPCS